MAATAIAGLATACGDDDPTPTTTPDAKVTTTIDGAVSSHDAPVTSGNPVRVNFGPIDDTANQVYAAGEMEWKGAIILNSATNKITVDPAGWTSPDTWPLLYDDGPYTAGGHEPAGATAGDHKWGVSVLIDPPAADAINGEYGLNDRSYRLAGGDGWIWKGMNGTFTVSAGQTADVTAGGETLTAFGNIDLELVLDVSNLATQDADAGTGFDASTVAIKSSAWGWVLIPVPVVDGKATFVMSTAVCTAKPCESGKALKHSGLLNPGDKPEFVFVLGGNADGGVGQEYFSAQGTTAFYRTGTSGSFDGNPLTVSTPTKNPTVTIPTP